jgi:GNAT superfamily N-acetyltransferase
MSGHEPSSEQMEDRLAVVERSPIDSLYVCEQGGVIVGALGVHIRENLEKPSTYGEISLLVVHDEARRQGVGRFMMEHAEKLAERERCILQELAPRAVVLRRSRASHHLTQLQCNSPVDNPPLSLEEALILTTGPFR